MPTSFNQYQQQASNFARSDFPTYADRLSCWAMGLAGETGELVDELKKVLYHNKELDISKLRSELGDVLWYISQLATALDIELINVANNNLAKLELRHGSGFKKHDEQNRGESQ